MNPADHAHRIAAVERHASLIVQAPAGSGKTSLLVQRFLRLLTHVEKPESILAITFTRKAAAEMRNRIIDALREAATLPCPEAGHKAYSWRLARAAFEHGEVQTPPWTLLANTGRLRVQTMDSLCADLARRVPLLSDLGALPDVSEDASALYREATEAALDLSDADLGYHVGILAEHLDGNFEALASMVITMLEQREQWLEYLGSSAEPPRALLQGSVRQLIDKELTRIGKAVPATLATALASVAAHAAHYVEHDTFDPDLALPGAPGHDAAAWQAIASLLLTSDKSPKLRSRFDRRVGVPGPKTVSPELTQFAQAHQNRVKALKDEVSSTPGAERALASISALPQPTYTDNEWEVLNAVISVLQRAVLELQVVFAAHGVVDFAEIQRRALQALGNPDGPSDLALMMDYRIAHMLVDEFQDTSRAQVQLLERLTAGWQHDDGRTLFLVGDPMQSIYRFRQAEVGNFLRARLDGIGDLPLESLSLETNFRSTSNLVTWTNEAFADIFPQQDDIVRGKIEFAPATAANQLPAATAVHMHAEVLPDGARPRDGQQSEQVAELVATSLAERPGHSVAILVRARTHLNDILPALVARGINFQAVDLEPLKAEQTILDIHALTLTLLRPGNVVAWMTVLRAPWCGIALPDLTTLWAKHETFWLQRVLLGAYEPDVGDDDLNLSADGRMRLHFIVKCYATALQALRKRSLRAVVEELWHNLGGELCVQGSGRDVDSLLGNVSTYFEALANTERAGTLPVLAEFERRLDKLFSAPEASVGSHVQIMTMHKAKGLEFDTVIIPGLDRVPSANKGALFNWRERPNPHGEFSLLMAPMAREHHDHSGLYPFIQTELSTLFDAETVRLMYVAATRARTTLHLLGTTTWDDNKEAMRTPDARTLLGKLWPVVAGAFEALGKPSSPTPTTTAVAASPRLARLSRTVLESHHGTRMDSAQLETPAPDAHAPDGPVTNDTASIDVLAADGALPHATDVEDTPTLSAFADGSAQTPRHVGTLVHRWLDRIASTGVEDWNMERLQSLTTPIEVALENMGVAADEIAAAATQVLAALGNVLTDENGRWVLTNHPEAESELALSTDAGTGTANYILDRTFVVDGVRWIVDYKVSAPADSSHADIDAFIAAETEKYTPQLSSYARLMGQVEHRPMRVALYFPMLKRLHSWSPD
jgi:ATP-dependent exoDNAse (exonuclease V) beta subunit